jgi:glycosyltransferase involved in cell wall biosynthesis
MIHLVYPHGKRKAAPWSIGNHLAAELRLDGHRVQQYDWTDRVRMGVPPGDILIGHPHEEPGYCFTDNLWQPFAKRIAIAPYNGSEAYVGRLSDVSDVCQVFAIAGPGWSVRDGWTRLDMAIDLDDYPQLPREFNPPGQRKLLYIGCTLGCKGTAFLAEISRALPDLHIGHIGPGIIPGTHPWGYVETETERGRAVAAEYDMLIAPGLADANPATILEAMAWGLIPICTRSSGWQLRRMIDHGDVAGAVAMINEVQHADEGALLSEQQANLELAKHHSFDRMYTTIRRALQ